jgi:hypothetical protein
MNRRIRLTAAVLALCALSSVALGQFFRRGYAPTPDRPLADPKEWVFARLAYDGGGYGGGYRGGSRWATDYPRAEYHFSQAVERLTRIDVHPDGQIVSPNTDVLFDYPWLYAVEVGSWGFDQAQATRMREYLLRGGFLMVDDFHGEAEWQVFIEGMRTIFPDRPVESVPETDPIYSQPYEIGERQQVPGPGYMSSGLLYERYDGVTPHWRGIRDDEGRWMVLISHNIDYGEGWEQADNPAYPQPFTRQAYEVAVNYLIYGMTH